MDWENIKTLSAVARQGSARRAATVLGVHHSTVTRRIEQLERSISARLFDRHPDGYVLTSAGERLLRAAQRFNDDLTTIHREIAGSEHSLTGKVRVTMVLPLAVHAFAPKLPEFAERHPDIEIELHVTYDTLDLFRGDADIAIRFDNNPPQGLVGRRLFPYYETVYATADYIQSQDFVRAPEKARWIGWSSDGDRYPGWTEGTGFGDVPVWGDFPDLGLQLAAVKHGLGLALLPCLLGDSEAALVRASKRPPKPNRDIWILTHRDLRSTRRVRLVMDFAEHVLRDFERLLTGAV
ncbi:MAG: LysR family transcriptional regulator [Pseudomonadota bacterium]